MRPAFQSYSPRVRPLSYDAIQAKGGCEPESGHDYYGALAFTQVCIAEHDTADPLFTQPDTVSYALGPAETGSPTKPFNTVWAAWAASIGVRIGRLTAVTPPANTSGVASELAGTTVATKVSHAFNAAGLLAIATQLTAGTVELKYYTSAAGAVGAVTFAGYSAVLLYTGLRAHGAPFLGGLAVYYLRAAQPHKIYARFEQDGYAVERVVMPDLRIIPARLISATSYGAKLQIRLIDSLGRDVDLFTAGYAVTGADQQTLAAVFLDGTYPLIAVAAPDQLDACALDVAPNSGYAGAAGSVFAATKAPSNMPAADAADLAVVFLNGEVETA